MKAWAIKRGKKYWSGRRFAEIEKVFLFPNKHIATNAISEGEKIVRIEIKEVKK
jgi:hypothetical protein